MRAEENACPVIPLLRSAGRRLLVNRVNLTRPFCQPNMRGNEQLRHASFSGQLSAE